METAVETQETEQEVVETEEVQATGTEEEVKAEETPPEPVVEEKPVKTAFQQRIDEITREKYEARREAEYWKNLATKEQTKPTELPPGRPVPPLEMDFTDPTEYRRARVKYEDDLDAWKENSRKSNEIQRRQTEEYEANIARYNANIARMKDKYADYDEVVGKPVFTPELSQEIMASEYAPEIGYYLAKNTAEAKRLSSLSSSAMAREIGRLEGKFTAGTLKFTSGAPKPINPVTGSDVVEKDPAKMTDTEWYEWNKQQKLKKILKK